MSYTETNSKAWDRMAQVNEAKPWTFPISHEDFMKAKQGDWQVRLTPCKIVPREWFLPFEGCKLLGLAAGGGQQMPVFAALGAQCTVLDFSDVQLQKERDVAAREGYDIEIVNADMTKRLPFGDGAFDLIYHAVSNHCIEDVQHVWDECWRVLRPGGVLIAGFDNGICFLFDDSDPPRIAHRLPFNPLKMNEEERRRAVERDGGSYHFSHTMEEQVGGQLRAGFILTHLYEDGDSPDDYYPVYAATRAFKP